MATVGSLLRKREGDVITIHADASAQAAAMLMNEAHIGSLVVTDQDGHLIGIFTERDLLKRVVARDLLPHEVRVGDVMTGEVWTCATETPLDEVRLLMAERRIRHVPVLDDGRLLGMISIGDLNAARVAEMSATISYLEQFITKM